MEARLPSIIKYIKYTKTTKVGHPMSDFFGKASKQNPTPRSKLMEVGLPSNTLPHSPSIHPPINARQPAIAQLPLVIN